MKKIARGIYFLTGVIMPILIGALHTYVHFSELIIPKVEAMLQGKIMIMGQEQILWNPWGLMSLMMGISFIVIGLLNLGIFRMMGKSAFPPIFAILSMIVYITTVIYVGYEYSAAQQFYGGIFGATLLVICLFLTVTNKDK